MPNNITNKIIFSGDSENIKEVLNQIKGEEGEEGEEKSFIDFNNLIPMPESLNIESGSTTDGGLKLYKEFIAEYFLHSRETDILKTSAEALSKAEKAYLSTHREIPSAEWGLGKTAWNNIQNYGAPTWYYWCINNWGTKWNAYSQYFDEASNTLEFDTAWDCPIPVLEALAELCYKNGVGFAGMWADEDTGYNVGLFNTQDGKLEVVDVEDGSSEAYEIFIELKGESSCIGKDEDGNYIHYHCDSCPNSDCCF